jgi:hypothetical protein
VVAALGGFLFGYDISIISGALIFLKSGSISILTNKALP